METKKSEDVDLERKRLFHFTIGLLVSVSLVIVAFEWRTPQGVIDIPENSEEVVNVLPPIPNTVQEPPKPKVILPKVVEIPNEEEPDVDLDIRFDVAMDDPVENIVDLEEPPVEDTDEIVIMVEEQPSFPGGTAAFYEYIGKQLEYPRQAIKQQVEGRVYVQFVVNKDGSLTDIQILKGIGAGCNDEAIRVLKSAPRWNPGKQRGKPVRVRMSLPITFKLR